MLRQTIHSNHQSLRQKYIGQAVGNFSADEWYPGGKLGTTENTAAGGYEDNTPAIDEQGLTDLFNQGDMMASAKYTLSTEPYKGWVLLHPVVHASIATLEVMLTVIAAMTWSQ